jgi:hypothetical protein
MLNFAFVRVGCKKILVPAWIEVPEDTNYENVYDRVSTEILQPEKHEVKQFPVPDRPYTIMAIGDNLSCSCPGFKFRWHCKHIVAFKIDETR